MAAQSSGLAFRQALIVAQRPRIGEVGPVVLPVDGTYTVLVDPYNNYTGEVAFTVYNVVDVTGPLTFGQAVDASLTTPGQRGVWTFAGTANQRVSAAINASTIGNCSLVYHTFNILKPDGTSLGTNAGLCSGANAGIVGPVVLPVDGTYTVLVDPYQQYTGQITVTAYNVVDVTGTLTINATAVQVTLPTPGQQGFLTFTGTAAQQVTVRLTANTLGSTVVTLRKPDGSTLTSKSSSSGSFNLTQQTLPTTGVYTVLIDPAQANTGGIAVQVTSP